MEVNFEIVNATPEMVDVLSGSIAKPVGYGSYMSNAPHSADGGWWENSPPRTMGLVSGGRVVTMVTQLAMCCVDNPILHECYAAGLMRIVFVNSDVYAVNTDATRFAKITMGDAEKSIILFAAFHDRVPETKTIVGER